MPSRQLPARPNLEQLKKQAKSLLDAAQAREPDALRRFAVLPRSREVARRARRRRSRAARRPVGRSRASTDSRRGTRCAKRSRRARCRSTRPSTSSSAAPPAARRAARSDCSRCIRGSRRPRCRRRSSSATPRRWRRGCAKHPELASGPADRRTGSRCSTSATRACTDDDAGARRTASSRSPVVCCALGANPNAEYHWNWHPELPRTALWARGLRRRAPAARGGAARSGRESDRRRDGAHRGRRRQSRGARVAASLRRERERHPRRRAAARLHDVVGRRLRAGPRWLLDHGADANLAWGDDGEAPLHVAARRWDVPMVELLVEHGADSRAAARTAARRTRSRSSRQPRDRRVAARARRRRRALAARTVHRRLRARRSRRGRRDARGASRPAHRASARAPPDAASSGRERQRRGPRDDAGVRLRSEREGQGQRHAAPPRGDGRPRGRGSGAARPTAPTSTRSTGCSRRRRWCGPSKGAVTQSIRAPITLAWRGCSSPQARRSTGRRPRARRTRNEHWRD